LGIGYVCYKIFAATALFSLKKISVIDMAKIQINSETILFLKIFLFGKPVSLLLRHYHEISV